MTRRTNIPLLILFLIMISFAATAQKKEAKQVAKPHKETYKKIVTVDLTDYTNMYNALVEWRRLISYDKRLSSDQKVTLEQNLDTYLDDIIKRVKLDSVKMPADTLGRK